MGDPAFHSLLYDFGKSVPSLRMFPFQDIKANFGTMQLDSNLV